MSKLGLNEFMSSIKPGSGQRVSTFKPTHTIFYPVLDETGHGNFAGATHTQFNNDAPRDAYVFYAVVVKADDSSKLAENWQGSCIPIRGPKTLAEGIGALLMGSPEDDYSDAIEPAILSTVDLESGKFTPGSPFLVKFFKDSKDFWAYEVSVPTKLPKAVKVPKVVEVPEVSISEYAAEHDAFQDRMSAKRKAEATVPVNETEEAEF